MSMPASHRVDVIDTVPAQPWPATMRAEMLTLALLLPTLMVLLASPHVAGQLFPALILIPVLFGVRYGFLMGLSGALLLGVWTLAMHLLDPQLSPLSKVQFGVALVAGCMAGHFRDQWSRTLRDVGVDALRHQTRLARFTSSFHLLQASHAQLENQLAGSPTSLRAALQDLKAHFPSSDAGRNVTITGIAPRVLELIAQCGNVHSAALHLVRQGDIVDPVAVAAIGAPSPLSPHDPLVRSALENGAAASIDAAPSQRSGLIAVIPLIDSVGHLHAVIAIHQMAFFAVHWRTFDLLGIVAQQVGDMLSERLDALANADSAEAKRACIERALNHARQERLQLAVVVLRLGALTEPGATIARCMAVSRSIDQAWQGVDASGAAVVVKLLPVPDEQSVGAVMQRLKGQLRAGTSAADAAQVEQVALFLASGPDSPAQLLQRIEDAIGDKLMPKTDKNQQLLGVLGVVK
jgi:hypothetical protein